MASSLVELSEAVAGVVSQLSGSVVGIGRRGSGVVTAEGQVVTNAHNLRGDEVEVTFADGRRAAGQVAGADGQGDLAVVTVDTGAAPAPAFAGTPAVVGQVVVALANPGGRGARASLGLISGVDVAFRGPEGRIVRGAIEHTAPLARGSSGGPVVDATGALLGIDTHRIGEGAYLAVPADAALRTRLAALARGEVPVRPRLGVALAPSHVARRLRRSVGLPERAGLLVHGVDESGPAAAAGVLPGDLVVRVAGTDVSSVDDLADALERAGAGASVELGLVRGAEERSVTVLLPAA
ncbi:MAG TPA: S1C family serine protease [Acidimicrobiales bacterium]|nr:S1C family serine protease [Acidimicrobiales bacterium]